MNSNTENDQTRSAFLELSAAQKNSLHELVIRRMNCSDLPLILLGSQSRSLGYVTIPRLTFIGDSLAFFELGYLLAGASLLSGSSAESVFKLALQKNARTAISNLLVRVWRPTGNSVPQIDHATVVLNRDFFWLAPMTDENLSNADLPVAGVIHGSVTGLSKHITVADDGSVAYLSCSEKGALALGKKIMIFATEHDAEFMQFEHDGLSGGVGPSSYEIELVRRSTFAGDSLLISSGVL
ncbi:MAG: hypothetical protein AB7P37_20050 [Ramlibacter sp.]